MTGERFGVAKDRLWRLHDPDVGATLSDDAILAAVDDFDGSLATNCAAAAEALFAAVAPICGQRPDLVHPLMRRALRPLFYLGYERSDQVSAFVERSLSSASPYVPHGEAGRAWLTNEFPLQSAVVQGLLDEMVGDAGADADD